MHVTLVPYAGEENDALLLIRDFWRCHNNADTTEEENRADLLAWTAENHRLYFICADGERVGFAHLGARGAAIDWLEDLFIVPSCQRQGIGTAAVRLIEQMVSAYSESLYLEAAARNEAAIRLYRRLGFDCLNSITLRRDFQKDRFSVMRTEKIHGLPFEIRRRREKISPEQEGE